MKSTDKYALYVAAPQEIAEGEKHFLITPTYCLLYTCNQPPKQSQEITDLQALPALAKQWLNGAIEDVRREYLEENQTEILDKAAKFHEALKRELQVEREIASAKNDTEG